MTTGSPSGNEGPLPESGSDPHAVTLGPPDLERLGDLLGDVYAAGGALSGAAGAPPTAHDMAGAAGRAAAPKEVTARTGQAGRGPASAARAPRSARPAALDPAADEARQVAAIWQVVVGDEVAANSRPLRLRQGRLTASASSTAWAQTLQFLAETVRARLNEQLGGEMVRELIFHHAGWEDNPRESTPASDAPASAPAVGRPSVARQTPATRTSPANSRGESECMPTLSKEQQEALAGVEALSLEPELKERISRAMRAAFVRDQQDNVR